MSGISFSGLATGLPPGLVDQLIEAERAPIYRFQQRIGRLQSADNAWGDIITKVSGLRTATDDLTLPTDWNELWKVTSSNPDAIAVERTGSPSQAESLSFTVTQLAQKQSQTNGDTFTGLDASLGARTLSVDGVDVTPADGTLGGLIDTINADDALGVTARAVQVTSGEYQLQLTASESGVDNAFTVTSTGWGNGDAWTEIQAARNAVLDVDGLEVQRSANTIDDLVEGTRITLKQVTADPVEAFIDGLNGVLNEIKAKTGVNGEGGGSVLTGDATARRLAGTLTNAMLRAGAAGGLQPFDIGVSITREGTFELDTAKLATALDEDFAGVQALFTRASTSASSADVRLVSSSPSTAQGTYDVEIANAATKASLTGTGLASPSADETLSFTTSDGGSASVTIAGGTSLADAVAQINTALDGAGVTTLRASDDGGKLAFAETRFGSRSFTVTSSGADQYGVAGTATGQDVVVRVDGVEYTGDGQNVTIDSGAAAGLELLVAGAAGTTTQVTVAEGLAGLMDLKLDGVEGTDGSIARARGFIDGRIGDYNDRIEVFERRLAKREESLRRQFAALESMIGQMNNTSQWLSSQISALPKPQ
jgi:flagellar hook-associated protein 2